MANARIDENGVRTLICALNTDGITTTLVKVNPSTHALRYDDGIGGTDHGRTVDVRDENNVPVLMGVSSVTATINGVNYVQGVTPVEVYADSSGNLLVNSN